MSQKIIIFIAGLAIGLGIGFIFKSGNQPSDGATIKIGYIGPLTGEAASWGTPGVAGAELAIKEINEKGGVLGKKLALIPEDDKCSKDGVTGMKRLVEIEKIIAVSGPDCSVSGGAALPIAQNAGVPVVIRWASAPHLTKIGDYIFRVYPSDASQGIFAAEFIYRTLGKKKAAVLYVNNDWGKGLHEVFTKRFKELGGEVVLDESVLQEDRDMRSVVSKVKLSGAEVLYFPVYPGNGAASAKQLKELELAIPVVGGDAFDAKEVWEAPGTDGILYTVAVIQNSEEFQKRVKAETGKDASSITAPMAYDSIFVIAEAIERAGSLDRKKIRDEIAQTSLKAVSSPLVEFDEQGDLKAATFEVKVIRNGKPEAYREN